jgi:ferredoxin
VGRYRIVVDDKVCIGTSQCTEVAPTAYTMNEDATLAVVRAGAEDQAALDGAKSCPVQAITVFDAVTGQQIYP